jgi:hypothetical protein
MAQRTLRNVFAGGALVVALTLAGPSPAYAAPGSDFVGFWTWLAGSCSERVASLWTGAGQAQGHRPHGWTRPLDKAGAGVDSIGGTNHQIPGAVPSSCKAWSDAGSCIDPNG